MIKRRYALIPKPIKENDVGTVITTIIADIDGSGVRALYARMSEKEVVEAFSAGRFVPCDSDLGLIYVSPSSVRSVQAGRRTLPVSSGPSSDSVQQHARRVTPAIG